MHPNPAFRKAGIEAALAVARNRAFGQLILNGEDGPTVSHIPFLIAPDAVSLDLHLVRSNPILRLLETPQAALITVSGPDGYVSPDWYETPDQVPTWNYVAIHLRGSLSVLPQGDMHEMLERQSAAYETRLDKVPWTTAKMTPDALARLMRQIVPCRMKIETVDSTFKLNQNKPDDVRLKAAAQIASGGIGTELEALAALMRDPPA